MCRAGVEAAGSNVKRCACCKTVVTASRACLQFGALVSMLENHYAQLPGTKGGGRFVPVCKCQGWVLFECSLLLRCLTVIPDLCEPFPDVTHIANCLPLCRLLVRMELVLHG